MSDWPYLRPLQVIPGDFRCRREEQEDYLKNRAMQDQAADISRTYLAYLDGDAVGYITIAMDAIELMTREKPHSDIPYRRLPAMKLCQLAVRLEFEGRGIGKQLVALACAMALDLRERVGCRYLTVDAANPRLMLWYYGQGFKTNKVDEKAARARAEKRQIDVADLPVSMRLDLHTLRDDLYDTFPNDFLGN